ncbi:proline--tRNA ligase [Salisaeta longa]|uniref:proline--tRNA ligase n=1 Tax=Salisaeta longa TaxID=503170 RepID=UPI0003B4741A|nr:proline--tRNA ligase [Salisaeta longa]
MANAVTPRADDYSQWYNDVVRKGKLADNSPARGCMIIRPNGMALWENMRDALDGMFKDTGHENFYFPIFIPERFMAREAEHVEGFAKECAVVTHSRLTTDDDGNLIPDPASKLGENYIVRPTSETIIWDTYGDWIQSYRDLPLLYNQWANVVRWEMRPRLFLRTAEFLWQEGHTAHATREEAVEEAERMLDVYATFAEEYMAMPVIRGHKTESERFPGAVDTLCIEALMQDGKALQAGTSHFLGQNFARAFDCTFTNENNEQEYVWATSWGVSTRLIGGLIMTHSDDQGLVLPPKLAPRQVVIVPIYFNDAQRAKVLEACERIEQELSDAGISVKLDASDAQKPGWKFAEYELQGVPVRLGIGPRDLENNNVELARRDTRTKDIVPQDGLAQRIKDLLETIQDDLLADARERQAEQTTTVDDYETFQAVIEDEGGFVWAPWDGTPETEARIQDETGATIRCIPFDRDETPGTDMVTGKPSEGRVLFAKAY